MIEHSSTPLNTVLIRIMADKDDHHSARMIIVSHRHHLRQSKTKSKITNRNCILYFLNLLYCTNGKYWFDCILARGTELYQHVLESVGFIS
jgi:hypothetical protein